MTDLSRIRNFSVRSFKNGDYSNWKVLWDAYLIFYQSHVPDAVTQSTWQRLINEDANVFGFGAFDGKILLGIVHGVIHRSTWLKEYDAYLEDLFVSEAARGKGVGHALIEQFTAEARLRKAERIYLLTHKNNLNAQALYDKLGQQSGLIQYRIDTKQSA